MRLKLLFKAKGPQHKRTKGLDCKALVHNPFQTLKWWQWRYKFFLPYILNPHLSTTINTICTSTIHLTFTLKIKNQSNISPKLIYK